MEIEPEDEIQDAVPRAAPERLPIPFTYHEPESRPRGRAVALAYLADLVVLAVGGPLTFLIFLEAFPERTPMITDGQVTQILALAAAAAVILITAAVAAFRAGAKLTGLVQCVFVICVLMLTASEVAAFPGG